MLEGSFVTTERALGINSIPARLRLCLVGRVSRNALSINKNKNKNKNKTKQKTTTTTTTKQKTNKQKVNQIIY